MTITRFFMALILLITLTAHTNNLQLVTRSEAAENDEINLPLINAKVGNTILDTASPNGVTLPFTVTFTADQPLTIYYTTNGQVPTTFITTSVIIKNANATETGPTISSYDNMLMALGVDATGSLTPLLTYTFVVQ